MDLEVEWGLFDHGSGRGRAVPGLGWAKACPLLGSIELALWWRVAKLPSGRPMKYRLATSKKRGFLVHRHGRTLLYFVRHRNRRPSLPLMAPPRVCTTRGAPGICLVCSIRRASWRGQSPRR